MAAVRNVLSRHPGVTDVKVEVGHATLSFDDASPDGPSLPAAVETAITKAGFGVQKAS